MLIRLGSRNSLTKGCAAGKFASAQYKPFETHGAVEGRRTAQKRGDTVESSRRYQGHLLFLAECSPYFRTRVDGRKIAPETRAADVPSFYASSASANYRLALFLLRHFCQWYIRFLARRFRGAIKVSSKARFWSDGLM